MDTLEDKEEKYRILVMALEKRCAEIKRSNEALAARYSDLIYSFFISNYAMIRTNIEILRIT
jgi:hypothetical protein